MERRKTKTCVWRVLLALFVLLVLGVEVASAKKPVKPPPVDDITNPALLYGVGSDLMLITSEGDQSQRLVSGVDGSVSSPMWTPDGLLIGFEDKVVKKLRINKYITTYPTVARDLYTVTPGGTDLTWVRSTLEDQGANFQWVRGDDWICRGNRVYDLVDHLSTAIDLSGADYDAPDVPLVGLYGGHLGPDLDPADGYQGWIAYHAQTAPNLDANPSDVWVAELEILEVMEDQQKVLAVTVFENSFARLVLPGSQIDPTWSPDGTQLLLYDTSAGPGGSGRVLRVVDVSLGLTVSFGAPSQVMAVPTGAFQGRPAWSPDGAWIAVSWLTVPSPAPGVSGEADIYRIRPDGTGLTQLTFDEAAETAPHWNPLWTNDLDD